MNKFIYTDDNKRYHTLNYYNKHKYNSKVFKACINAGLSCPNIDGTKGFGGCIYCDNCSSYFCVDSETIGEQINNEIARIKNKNAQAKINIYFQSGSNTYTSKANLCKMIETALEYNIVGITLGTRADCINEETITTLNQYRNDTDISVELGLQTTNDKTANLINRCHTYEEFKSGFKLLRNNKFRICVHLINGLPYETQETMINSARELSTLQPDAIKIHSLHIIKNTNIEKMYTQNKFNLMTKDNYINTVIKQLELFSPETVIERLTGDGDKRKNIAPNWSNDKISVLGGIDKRMAESNTFQGKNYIAYTE